MADAGRLLVIFGVALVLIGGGLMLFGRLHLPGDLTIKTGNATIYIPIATSIIASIILTLVVNLLLRQK